MGKEVAVSRRVIDLLYEFVLLGGVKPFTMKDYIRKEPGDNDLWQVKLPDELYDVIVKIRKPGEAFSDAAERTMLLSIEWAEGRATGTLRDGQFRRKT